MAKSGILCVVMILLSAELSRGELDIGTATMYGGPPYIPNACSFGEPQFPPGGTFASAGKEIWDDGAACGRTYLLKCTSASPGACLSETVVVTIVDRSLKDGWTLVLSEPAFHKITTKETKYVNLELKVV